MADLEAMGLVTSPHTSAGKVPTAQGLRFFVDSLIQVQPLGSDALSLIRHRLKTGRAPRSSCPRPPPSCPALLAWLVWLRFRGRRITTLRQVEFLPLSGERVLVVLVVSDYPKVENRIDLQLPSAFEPRKSSQQAANFINSHCAGASVATLRSTLLASMEADQKPPKHAACRMSRSPPTPSMTALWVRTGIRGGWEESPSTSCPGTIWIRYGASSRFRHQANVLRLLVQLRRRRRAPLYWRRVGL